MIRTTLIAGTAVLCLAPLAQAEHRNAYGYNSYQSSTHSACAQQEDDNRLVGGLIGAVAGGALGVAIADDNDGHRHRYRGHRHRGHGYRHHRRHHRGGDGDEIAGAVIGGILGAVVGSELAGSSTNCRTSSAPGYYNTAAPKYNYSDVPPPTRQPYGPAWNSGPGTANPPQPVAARPNAPDALAGGPVAPPEAPIRVTPEGAAPVPTLECTVMQRETRQADGTIARAPVSLCKMPDGTWQIQDDAALY